MPILEYAVIGAGPAAICAIANLLNTGVSPKEIAWIDPQFKVGDFGTKLSQGSSVPGNTTVENYQKVYTKIYEIIAKFTPHNSQTYEIDSLQPSIVCTLKTAAEPMQHITNELRKVVYSLKGMVLNISTMTNEHKLEIKGDGVELVNIATKRVLLATGAKPKTLKLPVLHYEIPQIYPNIAFIQSELAEYLHNNSNIKTVAVIGSSHSAALATMHLLKAGITVKQFMDKEYRYATACIAPDGTKYTKHDNTGLKGDVAEFTKQLLDDHQSDRKKYNLERYIGKNRQEVDTLLEMHLVGCSHAVVAIGYEPSDTLTINKIPLSKLIFNNKTTEFSYNNVVIKGVFGIGVAFPQEVRTRSGETESAVGVGKFWSTTSDTSILKIWQENHTPLQSHAVLSELGASTSTNSGLVYTRAPHSEFFVPNTSTNSNVPIVSPRLSI